MGVEHGEGRRRRLGTNPVIQPECRELTIVQVSTSARSEVRQELEQRGPYRCVKAVGMAQVSTGLGAVEAVEPTLPIDRWLLMQFGEEFGEQPLVLDCKVFDTEAAALLIPTD